MVHFAHQHSGDVTMPFFKKNPLKKLEREYQQKMEAAMLAMRRGDVRENALLYAEAEKIKSEIDRLR